MGRTRIKICGVCRPGDALSAAEAGADAIGLVFHPPARRNVTVEQARAILTALPPFVTPVGLFVDAATESIRQVTGTLGLRHVQLHGDEPPAQVAELAPLTVIKAVPVDRETFPQALARWRDAIHSLRLTNLRGLVLETAHTGKPGGTGIANDWEAVRVAIRAGQFEGLPTVIAAGGLRPETVGAVVRDLRPWAVDVSSGVEEALREKSREKVEAFVRAVREAEGD